MPRRNTSVKPKHRGSLRNPEGILLARSIGAVDLHFHGAFGIDLMSARSAELDELSGRLWSNGVAGFCPTTLSVAPGALAEAVTRLGRWVLKHRGQNSPSQAIPLGIHLEGPFINSSCCGAHPPSVIRKLDIKELNSLWKLSGETLKILTIAPETLKRAELKRLTDWALARNITLSLGHSQATQDQAEQAFQAGFRGITHAWNALRFHHRSAGALGAALGNPQRYLELIIDQVHVAPALISWTRKLHPANRLCFVSDCVPAAGTSGRQTYRFGPLDVRFTEGACRLPNGALAGGGKILTRSFCEWIEGSLAQGASSERLRAELLRALPSVTEAPIWALGIPRNRLAHHQVEWRADSKGKLRVRPLAFSY